MIKYKRYRAIHSLCIFAMCFCLLRVCIAQDVSQIEVAPPPFSEGIFPCSDCHEDMDPDPQKRELDEHNDIILNHGGENRWCVDCHDLNNRDRLHLAGGQLIEFKESYLLCGQCHGTKLRDWKEGIHGRRTGYWNGNKKYLLCASCHNPHSPKFKPITPMPPPEKNQRGR